MPIEIRELVIKAAVNNASSQSGSSAPKEEAMEDSVQEALEQLSELKRKEKER